MQFKPDIIIDNITEEMREWLKINVDEKKYLIEPHMFRFRYAGPGVPLEKCQRQKDNWWEIYFDNEDDAILFKLTWM